MNIVREMGNLLRTYSIIKLANPTRSEQAKAHFH